MSKQIVGKVVFCIVLSVEVIGIVAWLLLLTQPIRVPNQTTKQPPAKKLTRIIAIGDIACPSNRQPTAATCKQADVVAAIKMANPDSILLLGDLQYEKGDTNEFTKTFDPLWSDLKSKTFAAPGNHEYYTARAQGYFSYWNGSSTSSDQAGEVGKGYYSRDLGGWHIIALNSNCEYIGGCQEGSPQATWLEADLQAHKNTLCTLAFWHHPHFTSGNYVTNKDAQDRSQTFWKLLSAYRADVVLNGHDHIYERFARQNAAGQADSNGVREFIVGTGGKELYHFKQSVANHEAGQDDTFGFLQLDVIESNYQWQFHDIAGKTRDSGSNNCSLPK